VNFPTIIYENSASFFEGLAAQMKEQAVLPAVVSPSRQATRI
jgi:hypothetical protein